MKNIGKPYALVAHVRFDEEGLVRSAMEWLLRHRQTKGAETDRRLLIMVTGSQSFTLPFIFHRFSLKNNNDEPKLSFRQSGYFVQLVLSEYTYQILINLHEKNYFQIHYQLQRENNNIQEGANHLYHLYNSI